MAGKIKKAFNENFFHKDRKVYASGSQAANAMAVYMGLVKPRYRQTVMDSIVKDIRNRNNSLTAGDIGYRYLLCVLHDAGRDDVIYDMNSRTDVPGYGYQLAKGATALTESWSALPTNSNNHFMLGHIMEWFFQGPGGISQTKNSVAYKDIKIEPLVVGDLTEARTSFESVYGIISTDWKKEGNSFTLKVEIPANTSAEIYLPATAGSKITERDLPVEQNGDIKVVGTKGGRAQLKIGSGSYYFVVKD